MSRYFEHKTTFPNTHRRFRPAIRISRKFTILCGDLELKKNNLEMKHGWVCIINYPVSIEHIITQTIKQTTQGEQQNKCGLSGIMLGTRTTGNQ